MNRRVATTMIGEIVAADFRTAAVFERFGIDFCCGGRRDLDEACRTAAADPADVILALEALPPRSSEQADPAQWPLNAPDRSHRLDASRIRAVVACRRSQRISRSWSKCTVGGILNWPARLRASMSSPTTSASIY